MTAKEKLLKKVEQDRSQRGASAKELLLRKVEQDRAARAQAREMPAPQSGMASIKYNGALLKNANKAPVGATDAFTRAEEGKRLRAERDKAEQELYTSGGQREYEERLRAANAKWQNWWNANPDLHDEIGEKLTVGEELDYQAGRALKGFGGAVQGTIGFVDKLVGDDLAILGSLVDATTGGKTQIEKPIQKWADNALKADILGAEKFGQGVEGSIAGAKPSAARDFVGGISESAGAMLPAIATGGAASAAGLGAGTTQALNYLVFGSGAAGNAAKEAINNGASADEAVQYGLYSGMLEVLSESMFAGITGMNPSGALDDILKKLNDNGTIKFLTDTIGEGVEEGIVTFLTPYIARATYNPQAASATWKEMMQAISSGAAMSLLMNSAAAITSGSPEALISSTKGMTEQQVLQDKYGRVEEETVADVFRNGSVTPVQKPTAPAQEEVKEPTAKERLLAAVEADKEKAEAAKAKETEEEIPRMELKGIEDETESDTQPAVQSAPAAKPAPTGTATEKQRMQARAIGDMVEAGAAAKTSPAALGIENGGDIESITVLEEPLTKMFDFSEASEIAERAGYEPVYFSGMLQNANGGTSRWGIAGNKLYIQADSANYTAADIAKEAVERSTTNETIPDRGRNERYAGLSAGGQTERVSQQGGSQARRAAARANKAASYATERASDYISGGSAEQTLKIIPAADYDGELKAIDKTLRKMGAKKIYFTVGSIGIVNPATGESASVSGVYDSDSGVMMVRADSEIYTAQQLAMHEAFHYIADADPTIREDAYNRLLAEMSEGEMDELTARYQVAYGNIYGDNVDAYVDEILADAYAGINRENLGADRYRSTVNSAVMAAARPETEQRQTNGPNENEQYSIETLADGKKYVRADRQVIFGNDPESWSEQLEDYINSKIRRGQNVVLTAEDGDLLTLTADTAGKVASMFNSDGTTLRSNVYERKVNAGSHIDELVITSKRGKDNVADYDAKHGSKADKGWNYRRAFFLDFDNKYYLCTISVMTGKDGNAVYNIGKMQERSFPNVSGSSAKNGAQNGKTSFNDNVAESGQDVKQRFSIEEDSAGRELTEGQKKFFANSKATDWQGKLLTLYHQTENEFTVFETRRSGAGSRDEKTPFGIFLKSSDTDIGLRGKKQMELYANIENPLVAQNREDLTYQLRRLSPKYDALILEHEALDNEYHQKFEDAKTDLRNFMTEWRKNNPDASRRALYDVPEFDRLYNAEDSIIEEWTEKADALSAQAKEVLTQALRDAGYDGVFLYNDAGSWGRSTDAYIALDPEQVKNVDNVNPTNNPDIRYSIEGADAERERVLAEREEARQRPVETVEPAATADEVVERKIAEAKAEAAEENAPELLAEKMSNSRGEFTGSAALEKLGIKVVNSIGKYTNVKQLLGNARAGRSITRERKKAEIRLKVTAKEKNFARGIANGIYTESDIPEGWDKRTVMEMSEWYMAERNFGESYIDLLKQAITVDVDAATAQMFEGADESKVPPAIVLNHRTAQRNMLNIFGDKGKEINKWLFDPVNQNEAERIRFINRQFDQVRTFADQTGKQRALNKAEREMVQRVIEGRVVEDALAKLENRKDIETAADSLRKGEDIGDIGLEFGLTLEEQEIVESLVKWQDVQDQLEAMDKVIIYNAVDKYSALFDSYYEAINDFLAAHGYQPIGFIKGYVPHLQPEENQTALQNVFQKLGLNTDVSSLPTSIAGLTGDYKPNKKWNPYFLHRNSTVTQFDIVEAFESYVSNMADVLYHADDIMRIRSAVKYFRRTYSPEEIRNSIEWAENLRTMPKDEKIAFLYDEGIITSGAGLSHADAKDMLNKYIEEQYGKIENTSKFNNLVTYLENYANILAGKQSIADRGSEYSLGRKILNAGNKLTRIFSRANVAGNFSSALNQSAQLPTILSENGLRNTSAAFKDIITGNLRKAGWAEDSDFLTGKRGVSFIVTTPGEMLIDVAFKPLEIVDSLMSTMAVRGAYLDGIKQGMSHEAAMQYADKKAASIMGDRTKGAKPLAFEAKNLRSSMVHLFQIEALNSWDHIISDLPQDFRTIAAVQGKRKAAQAVAGVISKMLVYSFVLNRLAEKLYGGTPAPFDIFGLTANFIASGQELSTNAYLEALIDKVMLELFGMELFGSDEDERMQLSDGEFEWEAATEDLGYNISNEIPFLNNLAALFGLGDKTLPLPDVSTPLKGVYEGVKNKSVTEALDSALQLVGEIAPAGRQVVKTYTGAKMIAQGGKMKGFGEDARLQYPVRRTAGNITQALLFGASGLQENQDFYASGRTALTTKETTLWKTLVANGADEEDAYDAIYSTKGEDETYEKLLMMAAPLEWSNGLKYDAMAGVTSDSFGYKLNVLESNDIDASEYAEVTAEMYDIAAARIAELPEEDRPETVTISQEDAEKALKASNLSKQEKAIIWQMTDAKWSEKSNPFSSSIGKRVKAEYKEIKEQAEEEKRKEEAEDEIPRMELRGLD